MSDPSHQERNVHQESYLWILFLTLFLVLLLLSFYVVCHGACSFWDRYCLCRRTRCGCWCCAMDVEAYRRERESLRRLRALRRLHRLHEARDHQQQQQQQQLMTTFSQIPGPIPHSFTTTTMTTTTARGGSLGFGFLLVPTTASTAAAAHDMTSVHMRGHLSPEQRRAILEQLLVSKEYHSPINDAVAAAEEGSSSAVKEEDSNDDTPEQEPQVERVGDDETQQPRPERDTSNDSSLSLPQSYAFPLHEEPEALDQTCAICLDDFVEGELINDASRCPHQFHVACLLEWLDRHDVCPCCRQVMITDAEWRHAASSDPSIEATMSQRIHVSLVPQVPVPDDIVPASSLTGGVMETNAAI